jgi:hypothetical protein
MQERGTHTCTPSPYHSSDIMDVVDEMKDLAYRIAIRPVSKRPNEIWYEVLDAVSQAHPGIALHTMIKQQLISFV